MTRETRLGIAIAGTFLTIAGSWVGVKYYRGEPAATEDPSAAVAAENAEPKLEIPVAVAVPAPAAEAAPQPVAAAPPAVENAAPSPIKPDADAVVQSTTTSPSPPVIPAPAIPAPAMTDPPAPVIPAPMGDPPPPVVTPIPSPTTDQPAPTPAPITTPVTPPPMADPPPPVVAPIPPPVVETKKDPEPPPSAIVITKPADAPPAAPAIPASAGEPSVVLVPASPAGAASLGPPGGALNPPREPFSTANNVRPPTETKAQSYLEEEHRWQPGDGFASLSQKFYFSDKYAGALQQYNRDYPLAGASLKQNPPLIVPGQVIWVPPVRILERDYPSLVAGVQPLTDRGMPATNAVRPVESNVAANATQLYRVRERGETMYEIARRTLNDSGQWFQVHRLNPTLSRDPKLPIPAGAVLRLPAEAKLEAADKP